MQLLFGSSNFQLKESALTMGSFDGLHRGHRKLIFSLFKFSKKWKIPSVLVTYFPRPSKILNPKTSVDDLLSFEDFKLELQSLGLDYLVLEDFNESLLKMEAEDYLKTHIIQPFKPRFIVLGKNFFFGNKKKGTLLKLKKWEKKYSYQLTVEPLLKINECQKIQWSPTGNWAPVSGEKNKIKDFNHFPLAPQEGENVISSTKIKDFLKEGEVEKASLLLGRVYFLRGVVEKGDQRGRKIGYPTLNLKTEELFLPRDGVYRSSFSIEGKHYFSITNIGLDPTFKEDKKKEAGIKKKLSLKKIETFAFLNEKNKENKENFLDDRVYGKKMTLYLYQFLRSEKKFKDAKTLKAQIVLDIKKCKKMNFNSVKDQLI